MRKAPKAAVVVGVALLAALPAWGAEPTYEDERFESGVDDFGTVWGIHSLDDGYQGLGLKSIIPEGGHWGSSGHWYFDDHGLTEPDELYWRYFLKFREGFYIEPPSRGKLPGPAALQYYRCLGLKPSTEEQPCWSARMLFSRTYPSPGEPEYPNGPSDKTLIGFYTYHLDQLTSAGDVWTWDEDVALLNHGEWYCIEGRIRLNTPGEENGILQGWVDGVMAFDKDDIAFRRAAEQDLHIRSFWFDIYYGGTATSPVENEVHFDSVALSDKPIGCDTGFNGTFFDDDGSIFEADIEWLAAQGITKGCNPPSNTMFCPDDPVTREVMAVYIARALNLPAATKDHFSDDEGSMFEADINRMAEAGITKGCGPEAFCPSNVVDRGQMAAFLVRALGLTDNGGGDLFSDDDTSIFEADIDKLATAGITKGCNPPANTHYCPKLPVDRGAMAAFLHRAIGEG
jgi:hypothetical protein